MTDRSETIYTLYPVFKASPAFQVELGDADELRDAVQELENLDKAWEGRVDVRGTYSTVGFRADADLMRWLVGTSPQDLQRFLVELRSTRAGRWPTAW